jgi:hypothetical protein
VKTWGLLSLVSVLLALFAAWAVPAWAAKRLVRDSGDGVAGGSVPALGVVWLVWTISLAFVSALVGLGITKLTILGELFTWIQPKWTAAATSAPIAAAVSAIPWLAVAGAFGLGLVADLYGGEDGARTGWFAALRRHTSTSHRLKVLGIWALAFVAAGSTVNQLKQVDPMVSEATGWAGGAWTIAGWLLATLVIGLAARYVDRSSTRPGGALKAYLPLAIVGAGVAAWGLWNTMYKALLQAIVSASMSGGLVTGVPTGDQIWYWFTGVIVVLLAVVLGPVLATWRADVSGSARQGSAGALAMGVFAGYLLVRSAPLWLVGVFALVLIALLLTGGEAQAAKEDGGARAGGSVAEGDDARRDDVS